MKIKHRLEAIKTLEAIKLFLDGLDYDTGKLTLDEEEYVFFELSFDTKDCFFIGFILKEEEWFLTFNPWINNLRKYELGWMRKLLETLIQEYPTAEVYYDDDSTFDFNVGEQLLQPIIDHENFLKGL